MVKNDSPSAWAPFRWGPRGTAAATIAAQLRFEGINHSYGSDQVLHDISLHVAPGEIIGLLGASGCGKTTLLRIAAGVERQTAGRVLINEQEMSGPVRFLPPERRGVGLMFQDYALFPHLTILENVTFGLHRLNRSQAEREASAALRRIGLEHYAQAYPHMLSGGEQQRVALARAIAPRPGVLMMDEPFSGLDRRLRDDIRDETFAILREMRATCIIVTHDPQEAMRLADRIAMMRSGRLIQIGTPRELYQHPADLFVARFFSEFNEISGIVEDNQQAVTPLGRFSAPGFAAGSKVSVCVRPCGVLLDGGSRLPGAPGWAVAGRILSRRFMGDVDLVEIIVDGLDVPLISRVPVNLRFPPGEDVRVSFNPEDTLIFSSSGREK